MAANTSIAVQPVHQDFIETVIDSLSRLAVPLLPEPQRRPKTNPLVDMGKPVRDRQPVQFRVARPWLPVRTLRLVCGGYRPDEIEETLEAEFG